VTNTDLIARLRDVFDRPLNAENNALRDEAADEIERLRAVIAEALTCVQGSDQGDSFAPVEAILSRVLQGAAEPRDDEEGPLHDTRRAEWDAKYGGINRG
jgi:hypothetical protein